MPGLYGSYMGRTVTIGGKQYIEISDALGLADFAELVSGVNPYANAVLTADIDLNPGLDPKVPEDRERCAIWFPMCSRDPYYGEFLGEGHTISGLCILPNTVQCFVSKLLYHIPMDSDPKLYGQVRCGLFGRLGKGAHIDSLTIDGYIEVSGYTVYIGGICGAVSGQRSAITQCVNKAEIDAMHHNVRAGGITGESIFPDTKIEGCSNYGAITTPADGPVCYVNGNDKGPLYRNSYSGGIVGELSFIDGLFYTGRDVSYTDIGIIGCRNFGKLTGEPHRCGEIVGRSWGVLRNCYGAEPHSVLAARNYGVVDNLEELMEDDSGYNNVTGEYAAYKFFRVLADFLRDSDTHTLVNYFELYGASERIRGLFQNYIAKHNMPASLYAALTEAFSFPKGSRQSTVAAEVLSALIEERAFRNMVNEECIRSIVKSKTTADKLCRRLRRLKEYDYTVQAAYNTDDYEYARC